MTSLKILCSLTIFFSFISCNPSETPSQADRAAIEQLITVDFKAAWDVNDEEAMAAMFTEDADLVFPTSPWIRGRDNIKSAFTWDHPDGLTGTFEVQDIRFLNASTALINVNAHFSGGRDEEGKIIPDNWDSATTILVKQNGQWKYAALRVMNARMDENEVREKIRQSWGRFIGSWQQGDAQQAAQCFTENAINMVPGEESNLGRQEIQDLLAGFASANSVKDAKATTLELDILGPKAVEYGIYEDTIEPKNGKSFNRKMRYYAVWQLEPDGEWRWSRFIFNDAPL